MADVQKKYSTKTGVIPRIDPSLMTRGEPPHPPTLPELDDVDGTTGVIMTLGEGKDSAKEADDSPTSKPSEGSTRK